MPGFERGRRLKKVGMKAQDTAELFFSDVRVPATNVLGEVGQGFIYLMQNLPQERLSIAVSCTAGVERALEHTAAYTKDRRAFGKPISAFQNTRFELAEIATEAQVARVFTDRCLAEHVAGKLSVTDAAMAKWWTSDLLKRTVDRLRPVARRLRLHAGVPDQPRRSWMPGCSPSSAAPTRS